MADHAGTAHPDSGPETPVALADRLARAMSAGRVALGVAALATPGLALRVLVGRDGRGPEGSGLRMLARLLGIRDLALGVATLDALRRGHGPQTGRLLRLGAACDAVDALATLREPGVPRLTRRLVAAGAVATAAAGLWQARQLGLTEAPEGSPQA